MLFYAAPQDVAADLQRTGLPGDGPASLMLRGDDDRPGSIASKKSLPPVRRQHPLKEHRLPGLALH